MGRLWRTLAGVHSLLCMLGKTIPVDEKYAFVCMHACVPAYVCVRACVRVCVHARIHACVFAWMRTYVHAGVNVCVCVCVCVLRKGAAVERWGDAVLDKGLSCIVVL